MTDRHPDKDADRNITIADVQAVYEGSVTLRAADYCALVAERDALIESRDVVAESFNAWAARAKAAEAERDALRDAIRKHREETTCCEECDKAATEDRSSPDGRLWAALAGTPEDRDA